MTEWKPKVGEWVMVRLGPVTAHAATIDGERYFPLVLFRQAPQPDPHQSLKDAVVAAAVACVAGSGSGQPIIRAVRDLQAAQPPPSRYAGIRHLMQVWRQKYVPFDFWDDLHEELAKLEAEERA